MHVAIDIARKGAAEHYWHSYADSYAESYAGYPGSVDLIDYSGRYLGGSCFWLTSRSTDWPLLWPNVAAIYVEVERQNFRHKQVSICLQLSWFHVQKILCGILINI